MTVDFAPGALIAFLLVLVRASAWLAIAPPFNGRLVPVTVKIGLAAALGIFLAPQLARADVPYDTAAFVSAAFVNAAIGLLLGFVTLILFSAVQAAGSMIDLFGGFTISTAYDPFSMAQASVFGRAYQLTATTLLFAIDGHLLLVRGFLTSFSAVPVNGDVFGDIARIVGRDVSLLFVSAVEIAAPLLAALFLAEVVLGMLARAAPQLNPFMFGFPLKILVTILLVGFALPLLPDAVSGLLRQATQGGTAVARLLTPG